MILGIVLISVAPTNEQAVHDELSNITEIAELHTLVGDYDMIAKIEADTLSHLYNIVTDKIHNIKGILDTKTLPGLTV